MPLIRKWILPGTTIISDCWRAYFGLDEQGFEHLRVNHSLHFKDPETEAHTNSIESSWRAAKAVTTASGRKKAHIPGNLAKYMFYKRCKELGLDRTTEFYRLAGELYNPARNEPPEQEEEANTDEENISDDEDIVFDE